MSTLLEQASLVLIPSGYKEDVVYSQIPTSGAGDLSFTRASNGTRVNSAGLVEVCPWNLVQYSEDFSNGAWSKINSTVTSNTTTAPNGTTTADTLEKLGGSGGLNYYYIVQNTNSFEQLTNFFYVKAKSGSGIIWILGLNSGTFAFFDVVNGTALSKSSGMATSIESVGNGWYRCIVSQNYGGASSTTFGIGLCLVDGTPNYDATSAATQSVYIWGAQSAVGSTAKPYFPTTDRLNVPRLTYQNGGGGCPSLLLEPQRTNYFTYSEQFDNADWTKTNATITANSTTSPDGTQNADTVTPTTTNGVHRIQQDKATVSQIFTQSIFAKANGYNFVAIENGGEIAYFNINTGVVGTVSAGTASIQNMGNGWYRCIFTATAVNSKSYFYVANADNSISFAGDATSGIFVWGCQFEAGSYATSYIGPTTSASATRVADACFKTGISSLIGQTSGTVFCDFVWEGLGTANVDNAIFSIGEQSYGTSNIAISNYNGALYGRVTNGVSVDATVAFGSMTIGGRYKCAIGYANNDFVFYVNGANIGNDTSVSIPTLSDAYFQNSYPNSKEVNQVVLFKTRLTNAELASLTTI